MDARATRGTLGRFRKAVRRSRLRVLAVLAITYANAACLTAAQPGSLTKAAERNDYHAIVDLVHRHADVNEQVVPSREAPLHYLADHKQSFLVSLLLGEGANPNLQANDGTTPLHIAARRGDSLSVAYMLQSHADPKIRANNGWTPADYAEQYGHPYIVKLLRDSSSSSRCTADTPKQFAQGYTYCGGTYCSSVDTRYFRLSDRDLVRILGVDSMEMQPSWQRLRLGMQASEVASLLNLTGSLQPTGSERRVVYLLAWRKLTMEDGRLVHCAPPY
jgi:hypothetical protein